jgi:uncharacterized membrane protein
MADVANVLVLGALVGVSAFVYGSLPAEIPVHFGADGAPDRFSSTSWLSWMMLPLIAVFMTALFYGITRLMRHMPDQLNVPDPKLYRSLSDADKQRVVAFQTPFLIEILLGINVMFAALQLGSYQVAMGVRQALPWFSWVVIAGFMVLTVVVCVRAHRQTRTLIQTLSAPDAP